MRASLYDRLIAAIAVAGAVIFVLAGVLILIDVTLRTAGLFPLRAASALSEYALLAGTMAGAPWLVRQKGHVAVTSLVDLMPATMGRAAGTLGAVISAGVLLVLGWRAAVIGWDKGTSGAIDMRSIPIPEWIAYAILSAGFLLMAAEFIRLIARGETRPAGGSAV